MTSLSPAGRRTVINSCSRSRIATDARLTVLKATPSQLELFDYKPELHRLDGELCPDSLLEGRRFAFIQGTPKMLGPQADFKQRGQSGSYVSDHLPHFATVADAVGRFSAFAFKVW